MRNYLKNVAIHCRGNYRQMIQMINEQQPIKEYPCDCQYVTYGEESYPQALYDCHYPPLVLFYYGNLSLLSKPTISVVGSRDCSDYAYFYTEKIVKQLAKKYVIVSGLAKGIDGIAHTSALDGLGTVGFLGCGIDRIYPNENKALIETMKKTQLVISEYYGNLAPQKRNFPWRNRLIVAAGKKLCVMACRVRSGTMSSVNEAVLLDRDIYCLPFALDDSSGAGCLDIVNSGATLLTQDVLNMILDRSMYI